MGGGGGGWMRADASEGKEVGQGALQNQWRGLRSGSAWPRRAREQEQRLALAGVSLASRSV